MIDHDGLGVLALVALIALLAGVYELANWLNDRDKSGRGDK